MKSYIATTVVLIGLNSAFAQSFNKPHPATPDSGPLSGEEWRLKLVARLMSLPSPVTNGAAQLYGMGDEAAVDVLKTIGTKPSLAPIEMLATLDIIHMAFEHPASVTSPVNQSPRVALFLVQYLGSTTGDAAVKERITKETAFLQAVKVPAAPRPPKPNQ